MARPLSARSSILCPRALDGRAFWCWQTPRYFLLRSLVRSLGEGWPLSLGREESAVERGEGRLKIDLI